MNIQDFGKKYKGYVLDDGIFTAILLLLVGIGAFGLGRLSVVPVTGSIQAAGVVMTKSAPETLVGEEVTESGRSATMSSAPSDAVGQYVGSKNSDKYHLPSCSGAERIAEANKVWFASREAAEAAGYTPAGNCPGLE